jgi:hypothetical protein
VKDTGNEPTTQATSTGRRGWVAVDRNWLTDERLSDGALRMMMWLESHSDDYLRRLHVKRIAKEIGWSRDRVTRTLNKLASLGLVSCGQVPDRAAGTRTMVVLNLDVWSDPDRATSQDPDRATRRGTPVPHGEAHPVPYGKAPTTSTSIVEESSSRNMRSVASQAPIGTGTGVGDSFHTFWMAYPRKLDRKKALVAWKRMTLRDRATAIAVLPDHVALWEHEGRGTRTTPHPTTWLHGERWNDELSFVEESPMLSGRAAVIANNDRLLAHAPTGHISIDYAEPLQLAPKTDYGRD